MTRTRRIRTALGHIPPEIPQPLGLGQPRDIAAIILFLASDDSRLITGAEFVVDGGLTAQ